MDYNQVVDAMCSLGYELRAVEFALEASGNNPDLAVEYLIGGLPKNRCDDLDDNEDDEEDDDKPSTSKAAAERRARRARRAAQAERERAAANGPPVPEPKRDRVPDPDPVPVPVPVANRLAIPIDFQQPTGRVKEVMNFKDVRAFVCIDGVDIELELGAQADDSMLDAQDISETSSQPGSGNSAKMEIANQDMGDGNDGSSDDESSNESWVDSDSGNCTNDEYQTFSQSEPEETKMG